MRRAAKPGCYSCWACAQSSCLAATGATARRRVCASTTGWHPLAATWQKPVQQWRPSTAKSDKKNVKEELTQEANFKIFLKICFFILAVQGLGWGTLDLKLWHVGSSSLTRDWTLGSSIRRLESLPLDHQGSPQNVFIFLNSFLTSCLKLVFQKVEFIYL